MKDILKMIEEEANAYKTKVHQERVVLAKSYIDSVDIALAVKHGANFVLSKQPEILFDFFIWFRENGEKYIDMSVEKMIEIYLKDKNDGIHWLSENFTEWKPIE
nr:MAG TPA_asm: hypothetical protein [Caudoviricetes sp.]